MVSGISISLSGYDAASARLGVTANNIANQSSTQTSGPDGNTVNAPYVPQRLVQKASAGGPVTTQTIPVSPASVTQYDPTNPAADARGIVRVPNVDPAQQVAQATISSYDAQANIKAIKTQDDMTKRALDIVS